MPTRLIICQDRANTVKIELEIKGYRMPFHKIHKPVFFSASLLILSLVIFSGLMPSVAEQFFELLQNSLLHYFSWFYVLSVAVYLLVIAYVGLSRHGDLKLGPDHSMPDYSYRSWFAMLFSAGMGIGIVFFGVAEPVIHFMHPPQGAGGSPEAARAAMEITFFHWGLHAWAIYAIVALNLAYFSYRHRLPLTIRSALYPLLGKRIHGTIGDIVDVFAILSTVFGVATSLGYGALQINGGLHYLFAIPLTHGSQVSIIIGVSLLATLSVASGLDKGIKILSETNLCLALCMMLLILVLGPTMFLLSTFVQNIGSYFSDIVNKTFNLYAYQPTDWVGGWTLFYWGWWIAWSPFVGMFIARISRGRTIREFIIGVLFVPAGLTFAWMTVFGDSSLYFILFKGVSTLGPQVIQDKAIAIFHFLELFPFSQFLSVLVIIMISVFFITSADSGALVVDILASRGEHDTPVWQRVYWAILIGVVAVVLLLAGGLSALQTATIASAFPFAIILLAASFGLIKSLNIEWAKKVSLQHTMNTTTLSGAVDGDDWKDRVDNILNLPDKKKVNAFITNVVVEAFNAVSGQFEEKNYQASIKEGENKATFMVKHGQEIDFIYTVILREYDSPSFGFSSIERHSFKKKKSFCAEVFLREGSQNYDIMGYSKEQVIHDILDQYEKHMHFLQMIR